MGTLLAMVLLVAAASCSSQNFKTASPTTTTRPPTTSTTMSAIDAAHQVSECMRLHGMKYATQKTANPEGVASPFLERNGSPFTRSTVPEYSGGAPTLNEFESCVWPPASYADQTGYTQLLLTTVPGSPDWPGEVTPGAYADIVDGPCAAVRATYVGGHTGTSFSETIEVHAGGLRLTAPKYPPTGTDISNLSAWGQQMAYYLQPGESAILFAGDEAVTSAVCES